MGVPPDQGRAQACDFFTVETLRFRTLYVSFFIELQTRRVQLAGATAHPDSAWVTQQARNLSVDQRLDTIGFLIRDRHAKFSGPFDEVFRTEGVRTVRTPVRAPRANAYAERGVRTVRQECLDHVLVLGRRHLDRVLREFLVHYNGERPHRGLDLRTVDQRPPSGSWLGPSSVRRRDPLGGVIHEYYVAAA